MATEYLGLITTDVDESKSFQKWRMELSGPENSALTKIDGAIRDLNIALAGVQFAIDGDGGVHMIFNDKEA